MEWRLAVCGLLMVSVLSACSSSGGGGGSSSKDVSRVKLSGVVAIGAPVEGAVVTVTDSSGTIVGTSAAVPVDGSYSITLDLNAKAPFIVKAVLDDAAHYSVAAETKDATVNISHVTNLIVARLSSTGDPAAVSPTDITTASLTARYLEVQAMLAPLFAVAGVTTNPMNGTFKADGTGLDRVLDSLSVTIAPTGTFSNIEVAVKGLDAPVKIMSSTPILPVIATPNLSDLPASGTSMLIADLLARMTACYAVPASSRVDDVNAASPILTSTVCSSLFLNNDPAGYKNNGYRAGKGQDFNGMFAGAVVTFNNGSYEYTRANGDLDIGYRWVDSVGNAQYDSTVVRNLSGSLKLVGNQYQYGGGVTPYAQHREFLNHPEYSYFSVGYDLKVPNTQLNGVSLFDHVDVITPLGNTIVLKPVTGGSGDTGSGQVVDTFFLRLRSEWSGNGPVGVSAPRDFDTSQAFNPLNDLDDRAIVSTPSQTRWTFNYYLTSAPTVLAQTQEYRTKNRALSIGELRVARLASLTDSTKTTLMNASILNYGVATPETGGVTVDWSVPTGALSPTSLMVWGGYEVNKAWGGSVGVKSSARTGTVSCTPLGYNDTHCLSGNYISGSLFNSLNLGARDTASREFSHYYALY